MSIKLDIKELIDNDYLVISDLDLFYSATQPELKHRIVKIVEQAEMTEEERNSFMLENKDNINVEKLFLYSIRNTKMIIQEYDGILKSKMEELNQIPNEQIEKRIALSGNIKNIKMVLNERKEKCKKMIAIAKEMNKCYATEKTDEKGNNLKIEIIDSREISGEMKINEKKKLDKFEKFIDSIKSININGVNGYEILVSMIEDVDLLGVFPNDDVNAAVFSYSINKFIMDNTGKNRLEIEKLKYDADELYDSFLKGKEDEFLNDYVFGIIKELIKYADIEKFIMQIACKLELVIEHRKLQKDELETVKQIFEQISKHFKENKISSNYRIKVLIETNSQKKEEILVYSVDDINRCLKRFINEKYLTIRGINKIQNLVNNSEILLHTIPKEELNIIYTENDLKQLLFTNMYNFAFIQETLNLSDEEVIKIAEKQGINNEKILQLLISEKIIKFDYIEKLYEQDLINEDILENILKNNKFEINIDFDLLKNNYEESKKNTEKKQQYEKYLEFYKIISKENSDELSEQFMANFAENYDSNNREKYINQLEHFYEQGLLKIESIISWEDEQIINRFWKDNILQLEEIVKLHEENKISNKCFMKIYGNYILSDKIEYNERIEALKKGYADEESIVKAYVLNLISSNDLEELINLGFIDRNNKTLKKMRLEDFEKNAQITLGNLSALTKKRDIYSNEPFSAYLPNQENKKSQTIIIDPNDREKLFSLLKAKKATAYIEPNNPFYNYEFYAIPDESGTLGENSVVIAERFYEDKISESVFATNNATYFFRYKDLLYLSNLKKSEMMKERKNVVFTAYHILGKEEKAGRWGTSVVVAIAKTMLGKDLKDIKKKNKKEYDKVVLNQLLSVYTLDELAEAWNFAGEVDRGDYNAEVIEER